MNHSHRRIRYRLNQSTGRSVQCGEFRISHTDTSPEILIEWWEISILTTIKTIRKKTQKFMRSAILPLSRRIRADRVFTLNCDWSTDTMDARCKSAEGNKYAQMFANKSYFARLYPMDSKEKAGDALRLFCQDFGVPERLTFDDSKGKNTL